MIKLDDNWDYDPRRARQKEIDGSWSEAAVKDADGWNTTQPRPRIFTNPMDGALGAPFTRGVVGLDPADRGDATVFAVREFATGAKRDTNEGKLDFDCLSPLALERYVQYLHDHSVMADGSRRAADNWQKGMPMDEYVKSAWRHFFHWWKLWRAGVIPKGYETLVEEAACGVLFNVMGWLHEHLKAKAARADAVKASTS